MKASSIRQSVNPTRIVKLFSVSLAVTFGPSLASCYSTRILVSSYGLVSSYVGPVLQIRSRRNLFWDTPASTNARTDLVLFCYPNRSS